MNAATSIVAKHKNDLSTYLGDWMNVMRGVLSIHRPEKTKRYYLRNIPTIFQSFHMHSYDISVVLEQLNDRLRDLEEQPPLQLDYQSYAEAGVFLKAFYLFFRILLDDIAGIIEYFYKIEEPKVSVTKSFNDLLNSLPKGNLTEELTKLLERPSCWFPEMMKTRDNLVHHYESFLITMERDNEGNNILGYFGIKGHDSRMYGNLRNKIGLLLCEYQMLIDSLLDHFDSKFKEWYGIMQGKTGRTPTIRGGCVALPLWWAYEYGNYKHEDLQVSKGSITPETGSATK